MSIRHPELKTDRLLLRPVSSADLDDLVVLHKDPAVEQVWGVITHKEVIEWIARAEREWAERGHGRVSIFDRQTGDFLGRCGLRYWTEFDEIEIGWVLRPEARGRGVATEAAHACLDWGFRNLDAPYFTSMIGADNSASIAVAERLGMSPLREGTLLGETVTVYALDRPA